VCTQLKTEILFLSVVYNFFIPQVFCRLEPVLLHIKRITSDNVSDFQKVQRLSRVWSRVKRLRAVYTEYGAERSEHAHTVNLVTVFNTNNNLYIKTKPQASSGVCR